MPDSEIHRPAELLERLEDEHQEGYLYRGQSSAYGPPLWPSKYRRCFSSDEGIEIDPAMTVRGCGSRFHFRLNFMRDPFKGKDPAAYEALMGREQLRALMMGHIRNALGYALSEAMFQQAGWSSEGIDVTYDPRSAATFAMTTWDENGAQLRSRPRLAVVYRWRVTPREWTFDELRSYNYLSCPSFIPTREICRLFRTGSKADFRASLAEYQEAIGWDCMRFDLDSVQGTRPFEIIRLPKSWSKNSRVERQRATLLLPDSSRPEALPVLAARDDLGMMSPDTINHLGQRLSVRDCLGHGTFVEDVASRPGTERFLVDVSSDALIDEVAPLLMEEILPKEDHTFDLLANWLVPYYRPVTRFGTLPLETGIRISPEALTKALSEPEPERQFSQ